MARYDNERDLALDNPNWSGFVLLITILSIFNSLAALLPLPEDARTLLRVINLAIGVVLWADFFYLLRQSPDKLRFVVQEHGWMVLLGSIPVLRVLRIIWFRLILKQNNRTLREFLSEIVIRRNAEGTLLVVLFLAIVVFEVAVVAILSFEAATPGSNIHSVADAIWWASSTVSTVGYGDRYPVTDGGRLVAVLLMGVGVALFTVVTGSLAQWFRSGSPETDTQHASAKETPLTDSAAAVRQLVEQQQALQQSMTDMLERLASLENKLGQSG